MDATQRLAKALLADRNKISVERDDIVGCFACGRSMLYRGDRFCSDNCRSGYDLGLAGHGQDWLKPQFDYRWRDGRPMKLGHAGFLIACANCHREFDSRGLRCCSKECESAWREREGKVAIMAEVGMEASPKKRCAECGAAVPKWRNGRRVSVATRFCSPRCARKTRNGGGASFRLPRGAA
jgi:hypothetical protein